MSNVYRIPASNLPRLRAEIARLARKSKKLGLSPAKLTVLDKIEVAKWDEILNNEYIEVYYDCTVDGESPTLEGWTLIAKIEQVGNENLVREVPTETCPPEYRTATMHCDHCQIERRRKDVFVLRNQSNEYKQVGRDCLGDFLGNTSPEGLLELAQYQFRLSGLLTSAGDDFWGFGGGPAVISLHRYVSTCSIVIRRMGYVPRKKADMQPCTADVAWDVCTSNDMERVRDLIKTYDLVPVDRDFALAKEAIEWARNFTAENAPSNFIYDLGVICRNDCVSYRETGWASALLNAYSRFRENRLSSGTPKGHVGEVGKRTEFHDLKIVQATQRNDRYGVKTLVKFEDPQGNSLVWWATGVPNWIEVGKKISVVGTVKSHECFRDIPETKINHVKPLENSS